MFTTIIGVFATLFLLGSIFSIWSQRAAFSTWKPVPATVVDQSIQREENLLDDGGLANVLGDGGVEGLKKITKVIDGGTDDDAVVDATFLVKGVRKIAYQYYINAKAYISTTVYFHGGGSSDEVLDRFPVGRTVTAYVDPSRPSRSYMIATPFFRGYAGALMSLWVLSLLLILDLSATGDSPTFPKHWLPYVAGWWILGSIAVFDYASLRGPFTLSAAITAVFYFTLASLPYLIPWAKVNLLPSIAGYVRPLLPSSVPENAGLYVVGTVAAVGFLLFALLLLWMGLSLAWGSYKFRTSYLPVQGTVIVSEIRKELHSTGGGGGASSPRSYLYYWPEVQFEYMVDGKVLDTGVYAAANTVAGARDAVTDEMRQLLERYSVGSVHKARFDPRQPHVAYFVAEPVSTGVIYTLAFSLLLFPIPIGLVIAFVRFKLEGG